ncbi:ankyrin repeat domain-containing protein [Candidatus Mesenet endosymbiont of Phosphuga atrata]|uniref:ankyrin repeat domain-containing protein n=1 Tax=Candidatus Mesenet endosymbiont of Phosphuga atrata TaxID=3066221 RepID=UPI0030CF5A6F
MLIKSGGHVDTIDRNCNTPLHIAVSHNCERVAEILIRSSASVNIQGKYDFASCRN